MSPVAISKLAAVGIHTSDDDQARDIVRRLCDEPQRSELLAALDTVPPPARMSRAEYEAIECFQRWGRAG